MTVLRNDPCPCGSGRKFKKCCLGAEPVAKVRARRQLWFAWGVVAAIAIGASLIWGTTTGTAVGMAGAALVGAWILMHDDSHEAGQQSGGIMGSPSAGSGAVDRRKRASGPPVDSR